MNDILARRARRATVGIALSAALVAGIAPVAAIAAETSSPTGAVALQTEDAAAAKEKAYAAMQEALKNLEAAKDAAGPEILETIEHVITDLQSLRDRMLKEADDSRGPLLYLQAQVNEAQARYDAAHNQVSNLQTELDKACNDGAPAETINQLRYEIATAKRQEYSCQAVLNTYRTRLESQENVVAKFEANAEKCQTDIDEETAKRDALLDDLKKAQAAYDDASLRLNATRRGDTARCLTCNRQRRPTKLHQAGELEQRQASRYDRRQAREHGRHSTERNSTRRNRRRRPRNNLHSHTPHQELKIADRAFCLHQSTSPETKRGSFPQPRETSLFNCKNSSNSTAAS